VPLENGSIRDVLPGRPPTQRGVLATPTAAAFSLTSASTPWPSASGCAHNAANYTWLEAILNSSLLQAPLAVGPRRPGSLMMSQPLPAAGGHGPARTPAVGLDRLLENRLEGGPSTYSSPRGHVQRAQPYSNRQRKGLPVRIARFVGRHRPSYFRGSWGRGPRPWAGLFTDNGRRGSATDNRRGRCFWSDDAVWHSSFGATRAWSGRGPPPQRQT